MRQPICWRRAIVDSSAFAADPEPAYHLGVWLTAGGWAWHVLDARGNRVAQDWGQTCSSADAAKAEATDAFRRLTSSAGR